MGILTENFDRIYKIYRIDRNGNCFR